MLKLSSSRAVARAILGVCLAVAVATALNAQTPAARQNGTVKSINGNVVTLTTTAGAEVKVTVAPDASVLQIAPGGDMKSAQPGKFSDVLVGDKVILGKPGDTDTASRVILMKASDIAARNQAEQADWQKRGTSGLVKAVEGPEIMVTAGSKTVHVDTTSKTIFRRYAADSVKFQDAKAGTLADIHAGDQLSVRGDKSADGSSIAAEEVVTGTFANLSGLITAVDPAAGTVSFKDLATKKAVTVKITANSDVRELPAQAAAMFAARNKPGADAGPGGPPPGGAGGPGAGRARAGMDLSRMLARLPQVKLADLHPKDAVMIVASPGADSFTAITLLSGVEPLLSAAPGEQPITLSPWSLGAPSPD